MWPLMRGTALLWLCNVVLLASRVAVNAERPDVNEWPAFSFPPPRAAVKAVDISALQGTPTVTPSGVGGGEGALPSSLLTTNNEESDRPRTRNKRTLLPPDPLRNPAPSPLVIDTSPWGKLVGSMVAIRSPDNLYISAAGLLRGERQSIFTPEGYIDSYRAACSSELTANETLFLYQREEITEERLYYLPRNMAYLGPNDIQRIEDSNGPASFRFEPDGDRYRLYVHNMRVTCDGATSTDPTFEVIQQWKPWAFNAYPYYQKKQKPEEVEFEVTYRMAFTNCKETVTLYEVTENFGHSYSARIAGAMQPDVEIFRPLPFHPYPTWSENMTNGLYDFDAPYHQRTYVAVPVRGQAEVVVKKNMTLLKGVWIGVMLMRTNGEDCRRYVDGVWAYWRTNSISFVEELPGPRIPLGKPCVARNAVTSIVGVLLNGTSINLYNRTGSSQQ